MTNLVYSEGLEGIIELVRFYSTLPQNIRSTVAKSNPCELIMNGDPVECEAGHRGAHLEACKGANTC